MNHGHYRGQLLGALVLTAAAAAPAVAQTAAAPTFTKDVAPIFQAKCESCHRPDSIAPMSLVTYEQSRPWARSIRDRVQTRQMPPWHLDKSLGIQHFENDRSLSDAEIDTIVKWVAAGAPKGDMKDMPKPVEWPSDDVWNFEKLYGKPDLVIKSPAYTQKGDAMDAWYKPVQATGLTEQRWVRAIEMRPGTIKGRKITHHALARLQQNDGDTGASIAPGADEPGPGLFMEWAVGKQGEIMRENSGKLMLPGSKIVWDIHYHAVGEDITDSVELGIYFYPKGEEPKFRQTLALFSGITGGNRALDIAPNSVNVSQNFHVMKKAGPGRELPAAHAPARQGDVDGSHPADRQDADAQPGERLQLQLAHQLRLRRRRRAAAAEGHDPPHHLVARQHHRQQEQPRSEPVGRLGRPHRRRDGARLGEHHLHGRRGLQGRSREAQGGDRDDHERPPAAVNGAERFRVASYPHPGVLSRGGTPDVFQDGDGSDETVGVDSASDRWPRWLPARPWR